MVLQTILEPTHTDIGPIKLPVPTLSSSKINNTLTFNNFPYSDDQSILWQLMTQFMSQSGYDYICPDVQLDYPVHCNSCEFNFDHYTCKQLSSAACVFSMRQSRLLITFQFCMQCLDLVHSQIVWIMMSLFPCQGRIVCRKCFSCSLGPEGSPGESREFDMTLQGELKDSTGQLSPWSLGFLYPRTHSSSMSFSQWSLSFSLVVLLSLLLHAR